MDGVHDLGGRHGLGAIRPEADEPVFHADWERSVLVMFPAMAMAGAFNLDQFRAGMEQIPPAEYLSSTYYEHWMHSMIRHGVEAGIFDPEDLERRTQHYLEHPEEAAPKAAKPEMVETLRQLIPSGDDYRREVEAAPVFDVGDQVRVRPEVSTTHTRRAGYVRGRVGDIVAAHGAYVYPDSNALGLGEDPHHLYTVRFDATELWGDEPGAANAVIHIDLWEPYLVRV
ncbi:nitrile hydratase subunit beta [Pseudonocardia broussonetiae]|uniref:Nitrile hydratase subunit beta n=1 Tax=Pseudonocardia broussonetiae TaxID=2736640 RepID=A0A6M6JF56_9PSEU|nr:nitrile hydratase subunit beta [Pseudonocardia broussonetiae]QJY45715.1 nitrile hydratase subunit beta [Pseudonocardia broussonetiae]